MFSTLKEEKKLWKGGFKKIAGVDEAGRGPLAGPVIAAAVIVNKKFFQKKLKDSKKITPQKREEIYQLLINNHNIEWGIGRVSEKIIDKINIFEATKLAMRKAIDDLRRKPDFLLLDGNFRINSPIPQKPIIKGDEKVFSVALASILAKVKRDRIMKRYAKKFPRYGFEKHKGYPTKYHFKMLKRYGSCKIHRRSFGPVKAIAKF